MISGFSIGIMQPYFFPYLGHFSLIAATDRWVVFDVSQFTSKSWLSRNRVLHPNKGWQYINVPLNGASISIRICDATILNRNTSCDHIIRQLSHYKKTAPFYHLVIGLIREIFNDVEDNTLVSLNVSCLKIICNYLNIPFNFSICSKLDLDFGSEMGAGDWAPTIASQLGATSYVNPVGGKEIFDKSKFTDLGLDLGFLEVDTFEYSTTGYEFEPNLSIIDTMMWCHPSIIRGALVDHATIYWEK